MELYSVRASQSVLYRNSPNNGKATRQSDAAIDIPSASPNFQVQDTPASGPDFTAISAADLRGIARQNYDSGTIDQQTFAAISEPLPMHTIDAIGNVVDLSQVTDGTSFDFKGYYNDQLQIARSIGDPDTANVLQSVVDFMNA